MNYKICIFEDEGYKNLLPLVYLRPVYDLRCGILRLREKIEKKFPSYEFVLHCRSLLTNSLREKKYNILTGSINADEDIFIFINGRLLIDNELIELLNASDEDMLFVSNDELAAARLSGKNLDSFIKQNPELMNNFDIKGCPVKDVEAVFLKYPWDFIYRNSEEIEKDFDLLASPMKEDEQIEGVYFLNRQKIHLGRDVNIYPNVVIDASEGPVFIGDKVKIMPNVFIQGPVCIGDNCLVKANTHIYDGTSIGEVCKVGGEVENSIIHSYSNKQHAGFLGHSYLGAWVNIAADSNTSDLKNNYGTIKVRLNNEEIDTGLRFLGLIMGDHSKCGINTMFNTGSVAGVSCNIHGGEFPPKYIPSFCWGGATNGFAEYDLRKAVEVAKIVKSRRNVNMSVGDLEIFKSVFEATKKERNELTN